MTISHVASCSNWYAIQHMKSALPECQNLHKPAVVEKTQVKDLRILD